jgi:hypothetical protein
MSKWWNPRPISMPVYSDADLARLGLVRDGRGGYVPQTAEPVPPAGDGRVHHYGDTYDGVTLTDRNTIHGTTDLHVVVDRDGRPVRVWFRCLELPFTVTQFDDDDNDADQPAIAITAIEWRDRASG